MGILLVYDVTDEASFNNIRNWMKNIEQHASDNVIKASTALEQHAAAAAAVVDCLHALTEVERSKTSGALTAIVWFGVPCCMRAGQIMGWSFLSCRWPHTAGACGQQERYG
jgi:hypothetical protein